MSRAQLTEIVAARFEHLASFAAATDRFGERPILTALLFAKEGTTAVVVGISRLLTAVRIVEVDGFGHFAGGERNVVFEPHLRLKATVLSPQPPAENPLLFDPLLDDGPPWADQMRTVDEPDGNTIQSVVTRALTRRFDDAFGTPRARASAAEVTVHAFFATISRALAVRRAMTIRGLGRFWVDGDSQIRFNASEQVQNAIRLHDLRREPARGVNHGVHVPIEPLPDEPPITPELIQKELSAMAATRLFGTFTLWRYAQTFGQLLRRLHHPPQSPSG